jgi:hypothetical protein
MCNLRREAIDSSEVGRLGFFLPGFWSAQHNRSQGFKLKDPITFSAQCPTCKNEINQGPRDPDEMRRLVREDSLSFYCELCDLEWEPNHQELTNVECLLG